MFMGSSMCAVVSQVSQMVSYFEPLIMAAIGTASKIHNSQQQMSVLDQTKTLAESALQMLYTAKEAGGNHKVRIILMIMMMLVLIVSAPD